MEKKVGEATFEGRKALRLTGLLSNAYADYIAARVLLNSGLLREGCILANQCLEKQMKAYIETQNDVEYNSHETLKLYNTMVYHKYPIANIINKDFIKIINSIYKTRYFDQLSSNYHYTIVQFKFLAELDFIMSEFLPKLSIRGQGNPAGMKSYDLDIQNKNPNLFLNNYILNKIPKSTFLIRPQILEQFLLYGNSPIVIISNINAANDNNKFIYPSIKVTSPKTLNIVDWGYEEFGITKAGN